MTSSTEPNIEYLEIREVFDVDKAQRVDREIVFGKEVAVDSCFGIILQMLVQRPVGK